MEEGVLARALRGFSGCTEDELSLSVGTVVQVHYGVDRYWSYGCSADGHRGTFPTDYVAEIPLPLFDAGEQLYVARVKFRGQEAGDLSFQKGDLIVDEGAVDVNWRRGRCNGQFGIFPLNLAWAVDMHLLQKGSTSKAVPSNVKARVNMDLKAQLDEEIDLKEGEIVTITEVVDKDWFRGECSGRTGIFPSAFVTLFEGSGGDGTKATDTSATLPDLLSFAVTNGKVSALNAFDPLGSSGNDNSNKLDSFASPVSGHLQTPEPLLKLSSSSTITTSKPHARALFAFKGEVPKELSFDRGATVNLIRHVDHNWLEGELNGRVGLFPLCYVHVVVDTPAAVSPASVELKDEAVVLYDFQAQLDGDVTVSEGELVTIVSKVDSDWYQVKTSRGQVGLCPASYVQHLEEDSPSGPPGIFHRQMSLPTWSTTSCSKKVSRGVERTVPKNVPDSEDTVVLRRQQSLVPWTPPPTVAESNGTSYGRYDNCDIMVAMQQQSDNHEHHPNHGELQETPRRLSCPNSPRRTRTTPPLRPPPINFQRINAINSSKIAEISSLDRAQRSPHRPAPPVPGNTARRPNSVAAATSLVTRRSLSRPDRHSVPKTMSDTDKRSSTSSESDTWVVCTGDNVPEAELTCQSASAKPALVSSDASLSVEERLDRNQRKRQLVLTELVQTERDYIRDLQFCHNAFLVNPSEGKSKGVDLNLLFGNMDQILALSKTFLSSLEQATGDSESEDVNVGICFKKVASEMKDVYSSYCTKHEDVLAQLEKYEENPAIARYFRETLESGSAHYFDMSSVLIKPVQRIMKYPLILNELIKTTEDSHPSKKYLLSAIDLMTEVAMAINECKRKKDLVMKYRKDESQSAKLARLNLHSVMKKSQRIGMRLSSTLGLVSLTKDMAFDDEENRFRVVERMAKSFSKNCETFCTNLQDCITNQFRLAEDVADLYADRRNQRDVDEFRTVQRTISNTVWPDFKAAVEKRVAEPLSVLLRTFEGPNRLIEKRNDKLLDYDSASQRIEKNKDIGRSSMLREELQLAKNTYEALNSQLLEELPKLTTLATLILQDCVSSFAYARKRYVGRVTKLTLPLMEIPHLAANCSCDILDSFEAKHAVAIEALSKISFVPKDFNHSPRPERSSASNAGTTERRKSSSARASPSEIQMAEQSSSQRAFLQGLYPPVTLYCAIQPYAPADTLEIPLNTGTIVSVIKKQDPMGRTDRWFVDDAVRKGFVPAKLLTPMAQPFVQMDQQPPPPYTPPPPSSGPAATSTELEQQQQGQRPVSYYDTVPLEYDGPNRCGNDGSPTWHDVHRYEQPCEALDERTTFVAWDMGANLTTVDVGSYRYENLDPVQSEHATVQPQLEYYYATYEFRASGPHELSLAHNQVVLVRHKHDLDHNCDWWYVEDRYGNQGYAPASYLAKYLHDAAK